MALGHALLEFHDVRHRTALLKARDTKSICIDQHWTCWVVKANITGANEGGLL